VWIPSQAPRFLDVVVLFVRTLFQVPQQHVEESLARILDLCWHWPLEDQWQHHVVEHCQEALQPLEGLLDASSHCDVKFECGSSQSQW